MMKNIITVHDAGFQRRKQCPEMFDLSFWAKQESYSLIKQYCNRDDDIIEIGCLTGHHLLLLAQEGYTKLNGIDFCKEAIAWADEHNTDNKVKFTAGAWPYACMGNKWMFDKVILFDVLEHVHNVKDFLESVIRYIDNSSHVLIMVPLGQHYMDEGHVNFWTSPGALTMLLQYYFKVDLCYVVDNGTKLFALCRKQGDE